MLEIDDGVVLFGGAFDSGAHSKMLVFNVAGGVAIEELIEMKVYNILEMLLLTKGQTTPSTTKLLLIADNSGILILWDINARKPLHTVREGQGSRAKALVELNNGSVACLLWSIVEVWDVVSCQLLLKLSDGYHAHSGVLCGLVKLNQRSEEEGGELIATGANDKKVKVWSTQKDGTFVRGFEARGAVSHLLRLKNTGVDSGDPILCTGDCRTLRVWRLTHPRTTHLATIKTRDKIDRVVELKNGYLMVTTEGKTAEVFKLTTR